MDETALDRALARVGQSRVDRLDSVRLEAALAHSRRQLESLAGAAESFERSLPDRVGEAIQEGLHREMLAAGRNLAEIRGLLNQAIRRLERLEQEILAERSARIDDLEVLVDLVSSGWQGVDARLRRLEERGGAAPGPTPLLPLAEPVDALAS